MKVRIFLLTVLFAVSLIFNLSLRVPNQAVVQAQATSNCPTTEIPAVAVGSNNDVFLLPDPLKLTLLNAGGDASFFTTNDQNFGGNATLTRIAQAGGSAKGLTISSVGGKAVALSCRRILGYKFYVSQYGSYRRRQDSPVYATRRNGQWGF